MKAYAGVDISPCSSEKSPEVLTVACFLLGSLFDHEDISLRNVGIFMKYLALQQR
jgi:hypothetical protein